MPQMNKGGKFIFGKSLIIDNEGLWQRLNLLFMYLPLGILAVKYLRH